jgi:hypothetical protein
LKRLLDSDKGNNSWASRPEVQSLIVEIDKKVRALVTVTPQITHIRFAGSTGAFMEVVRKIEQLSNLCPENPEIRFAHICALGAATQGLEATKELELFVKRYPEHLEAKRMAQQEDWPLQSMFGLPPWNEYETRVPEVLLRRQASFAWQSVRDGIFRIVAGFIACSKSDLRTDLSPRTRCKIKAEFMSTPYGPVVGLYALVEDDPSAPFYSEQWMNPVYDVSYQPPDCLSNFLIQHLATQEYTYVVLNKQDQVLLNRRLISDTPTKGNLSQVARDVAMLDPAKLTLDFQKATRWYTEHFDYETVCF